MLKLFQENNLKELETKVGAEEKSWHEKLTAAEKELSQVLMDIELLQFFKSVVEKLNMMLKWIRKLKIAKSMLPL